MQSYKIFRFPSLPSPDACPVRRHASLRPRPASSPIPPCTPAALRRITADHATRKREPCEASLPTVRSTKENRAKRHGRPCDVQKRTLRNVMADHVTCKRKPCDASRLTMRRAKENPAAHSSTTATGCTTEDSRGEAAAMGGGPATRYEKREVDVDFSCGPSWARTKDPLIMSQML